MAVWHMLGMSNPQNLSPIRNWTFCPTCFPLWSAFHEQYTVLIASSLHLAHTTEICQHSATCLDIFPQLSNSLPETSMPHNMLTPLLATYCLDSLSIAPMGSKRQHAAASTEGINFFGPIYKSSCQFSIQGYLTMQWPKTAIRHFSFSTPSTRPEPEKIVLRWLDRNLFSSLIPAPLGWTCPIIENFYHNCLVFSICSLKHLLNWK